MIHYSLNVINRNYFIILFIIYWFWYNSWYYLFYNDLFLDPLDAAPKMMQVVKFLKPFDSQWHLIGVSLELEVDKLVMIDNRNNSSCLAAVLDAWRKSSPGLVPYTWRSVIDVVDALGDSDNVKRNIETFLLKQ